MRKILVLFTLVHAPFLLLAQASTRKYETLAIAGFFIAAIIALVVYYIVWKNAKKKKSLPDHDHGNVKVKTFEVVKNGRRVIMTKKYRATTEGEFPEEARRKKS